MHAEADIGLISWPLERAGEALQALAQASGLCQGGADIALPAEPPAEVLAGPLDDLDRWLDWASARLGLQAESVDATLPQFAALLRRGGPALLHIHTPERGRRIVLLLKAAPRGRLCLLGTDLRRHVCALETLRALACAAFEQPLRPGIDRLMDAAAVAPSRRDAVRRLMLDERLAAQRVGGCWILRHASTAGFAQQLLHARLPQRLAGLLALFALIYALEIAGWKLIGEAALDGRLDTGWLGAWVLMLLALVPLRALSAGLDAGFTLHFGRLLKQRLLAGALRLDLDLVRQQGAGQMLGRVMESQALEGLALSGGLGVLVATLELGFAAWILAQGAAPTLHLALLALWLVASAAFTARYLRVLRRWTQQRLDMGQALIERMVGHRTTLAQELPARRDAQDDRTLGAYLQTSQRMDRALTPIVALLPAGWIIVALAGLGPAFVGSGLGPALVNAGATPAGLAISLGGILFAHRALGGISGGLSSLARAALAWRRVGELFRAGAADRAAAQPPYIGRATGREAGGRNPALVQAAGLEFSYGNGNGSGNSNGAGPAPVLQGAGLRIAHGERLLLEGPSGGGKSTLASLLVGLRRPQRGLLLLAGLDRPTLGDSWHRLATEAPQFHENHVLTGTLAFNLLMGRNWPASEAELAEAQRLCEELGLGPLIARMPAGLQQRIGETGWQLSHGERSRLFLARALLQKAPLTVLDESFAALDPATLKRCLDCTVRHTQSLVVIAHP